MSIPKEPRQLMINIMYLVLTAMLALNVSAEIFNAFKIVDKGLDKSNKAIEQSNDALPDAIRTGAKKKASLAKYADQIDPARDLSSTLFDEITDVMNRLIDESGDRDGSVGEGDYVEKAGLKELKGKKNKDVATRMLVYDPLGEELKTKLLEYHDNMVNLVDEADRDAFSNEIPKIVDDETWQKKAKTTSVKNWSEFNFRQMPVQAVLPILRKFQNDIRGTESALLGYLANKVGTNVDVVLDKFTVVSSPEKTYIIKGEKFNTDVFMSATTSGDSQTKVTVKVNGRSLPVDDDGVASFTETAGGVGKKSYEVEATVFNPADGKTQTFKKTYEYEVGERSATISAAKMNVFYIGVDNPVEVSVAGVPSSKVKVNMSGGGGTIKKTSNGQFMVNVTQPTANAKVTVSAEGFKADKNFRVKRIPDPVAKVGRSQGGRMGNGDFKAQLGLIAHLEGFDFDAKCKIQGFNLVKIAKRQDAVEIINPGGRWSADAQRLIKSAKPGDSYMFENVKARCPGDKAGREINTLTFRIR